MSLRAAVRSVVLLLAAATAAGQTTAAPLTFSRVDYTSDAGARGIVAADFDNDGAIDFATANAGSNTVDVFMNREFAGGGFAVGRYAVGAGPFDVTTADFNYDGYPDLVVAAADADEIDVLFGGPGGIFHSPRRLAAPGNPRGVAVGWLGFGGGYTIAYSSYMQGTVSLLTYDYNAGTFSPGLTLNAGASPQGVAIGYFNPNGGYPDIVVANAGGTPMTLLLNNGDGTFTRSTLAGATNLNVLVTADLDGDGRRDLAAASTAQNFVAIYLNSATGLHWTANLAGGTVSSPRGLAVADVNFDGHPELMVASRASSSVTIFIGGGSGSMYSSYLIVRSGSGSRAVAAADFDGDGRVDLATANEYASSATVLSNSTRSAGGPGATAWVLRAMPDATPDPWAKGGPFAAADFNHNGIPDIVVGDGIVLDAAKAVKVDGGRQYLSVSSAVVGDFNEDGNTDFAWVVQYYEQVNSSFIWRAALDFLMGDGTGQFARGYSLPLTYGYGMMAADLNGDGHLDVVVFDGAGDGSETRKILLGRGDGTFAETDSPSAQYEFLRAAADVTGDGKMDLVVWNFGQQQIGIYPGDGSGQFSTENFLPPLSSLYELQVADVNGDGHPDFVAIRNKALVAWLNRGDGTFDDPVLSDLPTWTYEFVLGDFTGDGHLDALTDGGTLAVGRGDGTFDDNRTVNIQFSRAVTSDIDRDGLTDLFIGTYEYTAMALYNKTTEQPNAAPVLVVAPTNVTIAFVDQFSEEPQTVSAARTYDPNLDPLSFTWEENGRVIATGNMLYLNFASGTHSVTLSVRDNAGAQRQQAIAITVTPYEEIVAHTGYMAAPYGAWTLAPDATAADGYAMWHPNANAAKVTTPLASPANYIELGFPADPAQEYKLWIRLKAQSNSPYNDSVYVQFEGAVDGSGAPAYPIGSTSGLAVNLEECSGCGLSGWGWRDEAWGTRGAIGTVTLRFPAQGANNRMWHRVRIQTREDGVMVDQIVLSAVKYKSTRPGTVKSDGTILAMTVPWE